MYTGRRHLERIPCTWGNAQVRHNRRDACTGHRDGGHAQEAPDERAGGPGQEKALVSVAAEPVPGPPARPGGSESRPHTFHVAPSTPALFRDSTSYPRAAGTVPYLVEGMVRVLPEELARARAIRAGHMEGRYVGKYWFSVLSQ